jgi:hypothetical protein
VPGAVLVVYVQIDRLCAVMVVSTVRDAALHLFIWSSPIAIVVFVVGLSRAPR